MKNGCNSETYCKYEKATYVGINEHSISIISIHNPESDRHFLNPSPQTPSVNNP